jgi:hypothetical protein
MQTIVEKITTYERNPPGGDWFTKAVFWGGLMDAPNDGTYLPESQNAYEVKNVRSKPLMPSHMTIDEYYDMWSINGPYTSSGDNLNRNKAVNSVNSGASFINFAGQAYYDGWALLEYSDAAGIGTIDGIPYFGFSELYWYTDGATATNGYMLPLMYLSGCDAAVFNFTGAAKDRSQERMLTNPDGGAIGVISSTAHTYRGEENENSYGNWWLDENFIRLMYQEGNYQPGKALYKLKELSFKELEDKDGGNWLRAVRSNTYGYILLGDPELKIWTNIPRTLDVETEDLFIGDGAAALVTVKDSFNNKPVEGALVNIMNNDLYLQGYTNETGVAKIPMYTTETGPVEIIVTAHDYYPKELERDIIQKPVDLVVKAEDMWLDIVSPVDGDDVQVFARVYNEGGTTLSQEVTVRFYQDEIAADSQIGTDLTISGIAPADYQPVSVMWKAKYKPGGYRIYVKVDPQNNLVGEYSKDNNMASILAPVGGADLWVENTDLVLKPGTLVGENSDIEFNVTIHNTGLVNVQNVRIAIYDGYPLPSHGNEIDTLDGNDIIMPVIYRNSTTATGGKFKLDGGKHDLHVFIDADNGTYEVSEGNNIAVKSITVNHAPRLDNLPDITLFEDKYKEKAIDLREQKYVYDHDNLTSQLRFSVLSVGASENLTVTISNNRYVDLIPAENWTTLQPVMVTIGVTDGLSTDTATFNVSVSAEADPPAIDPLGTITGKANKQLVFKVNAYDSDGDALSFYDNTDIFDIDIYTGEVNFTVNDTHVGTHEVTITVSDGTTDVKMTFTLEIRPRDNLPPVLSKVENINAKVGKPFKVLLRATDPDGDTLTFSMDPPLFEISSVSPTSAQLSFTPNKNDVVTGLEVYIFVSDGVETDSQKITITITEEKEGGGGPDLGSLDPMLMLLIIVPIIIIVLVAFLALRRKAQADRDMQIWESMEGGDRDEAHKRTVEDLGPLDRDELKHKPSLIEEELMDPALRQRDKPVIYEAGTTDVSTVPEAPPVIAEEEVPELPEDETPLIPEEAEEAPAPAKKPKPIKKTVKKMKKKAR